MIFFIKFKLFSKPLNKLIDDTGKKNRYGQCIDKMHNFQIDIIWPVWIFFPEEVHNTNLAKKDNTRN